MTTGQAIAMDRLTVTRPAPVPIERLVLVRDVDEVIATLPRIFNLCRAAQETALRLAFDRPASMDGIAEEILREGMMRLCVMWPQMLGLTPARPDMQAPRRALFGDVGAFPGTVAAFQAFLASDQGVAPVLRAINNRFAPGVAAVSGLSDVTDATVMDAGAVENSPALRHADHPVLTHIAQTHGRAPLWRAVARVLDVQSALLGTVPAMRMGADGVAIVPAARGVYAVRARTDGGRVTAFSRITPTDHMLATGGAIDQTLDSLSNGQRGLAPLALALMDPCVPLTIKGLEDA